MKRNALFAGLLLIFFSIITTTYPMIPSLENKLKGLKHNLEGLQEKLGDLKFSLESLKSVLSGTPPPLHKRHPHSPSSRSPAFPSPGPSSSSSSAGGPPPPPGEAPILITASKKSPAASTPPGGASIPASGSSGVKKPIDPSLVISSLGEEDLKKLLKIMQEKGTQNKINQITEALKDISNAKDDIDSEKTTLNKKAKALAQKASTSSGASTSELITKRRSGIAGEDSPFEKALLETIKQLEPLSDEEFLTAVNKLTKKEYENLLNVLDNIISSETIENTTWYKIINTKKLPTSPISSSVSTASGPSSISLPTPLSGSKPAPSLITPASPPSTPKKSTPASSGGRAKLLDDIRAKGGAQQKIPVKLYDVVNEELKTRSVKYEDFGIKEINEKNFSKTFLENRAYRKLIFDELLTEESICLTINFKKEIVEKYEKENKSVEKAALELLTIEETINIALGLIDFDLNIYKDEIAGKKIEDVIAEAKDKNPAVKTTVLTPSTPSSSDDEDSDDWGDPDEPEHRDAPKKGWSTSLLQAQKNLHKACAIA